MEFTHNFLSLMLLFPLTIMAQLLGMYWHKKIAWLHSSGEGFGSTLGTDWNVICELRCGKLQERSTESSHWIRIDQLSVFSQFFAFYFSFPSFLSSFFLPLFFYFLFFFFLFFPLSLFNFQVGFQRRFKTHSHYWLISIRTTLAGLLLPCYPVIMAVSSNLGDRNFRTLFPA